MKNLLLYVLLSGILHGVCKFGKTCKYPYVKASSQTKFQHKANSAQLLEQHMINVEHEHALKLEEYKKKMGQVLQEKDFQLPQN